MIIVQAHQNDTITLLKEVVNTNTKNYEKIIEEETKKRGFVEFTEKEIEQMSKTIKKLKLINKNRCRLRTKQSGTKSTTYEIRFRSNGYNVSASGKTIEIAKTNMIEKLKNAKPISKNIYKNSIPTTFTSFTEYYIENSRKEKVSEETLKTDLKRYNKYLFPFFKEKEIAKITPLEIKQLLNSVKEKGKTADELYSLMNRTFECAIIHDIISISPTKTVLHIQHERESGIALSKEEEKKLFDYMNTTFPKEPVLILSIALSIFCGLRPNEIKTAKIENQFIIAKNSKRKNKKIEYKKIPIIKRLKPFLPNKIKETSSLNDIRKALKKILPDHILYDLRRTFYTRCKEFGVSDTARDEFFGHSQGKLEKAYTSLSDEYLLKEGRKLNKW